MKEHYLKVIRIALLWSILIGAVAWNLSIWNWLEERFSKFLDVNHFYFIYSAMTQAVGALIALVGIFIVFKLQIQRQRLSTDYGLVAEKLTTDTTNPVFPSPKVLDERMEAIISPPQ